MSLPATSLYDLSYAELVQQVESWDMPRIHARRMWRYLYRQHATSIEAMADLPRGLRQKLASEYRLQPLEFAAETHSADGLTNKYLLTLDDGRTIETVRMQYRGRTTACLSSQVGCALGCVFCATGQLGFTRNLTTGEIVAQAMHVARSSSQRLRNLVVMGMGEPLLNYDAVMKALEIASSNAGLAIGAKRITLSTVGIVPGILRMAEEKRPYSLAVSLHAATQAERAALLPIARTWPLDVLLDACRYYVARTQRKIFFEWTLIAGENDSADHAHSLAELLRGLLAHVNLIPLNPTAGYDGAASRSGVVDQFQVILRDAGLPSTLRQRRGLDVAAGCGQLAGAARSVTNVFAQYPARWTCV